MKTDIIAFGAHPDDVELGCGGTIFNATQQGKTVGIIDLTRGELSTRGNVKSRAIEAANAAIALGVSIRFNVGLSDGFISNSKENQFEIIKLVRHYRPEVVFCNSVEDRHPDHAKSNLLVRVACYLSGLKKINSIGKDGNNQKIWRPKSIYSYIQWNNLKPDFVVDISGSIDAKMSAVQAYTSQFFDPLSLEPETPISSKNFIDSVRYRAADLGRLAHTSYAEGFITNRPILVKSIFDLK